MDRRSSPTISTSTFSLGDETALPAIGRRVETLRPGVPGDDHRGSSTTRPEAQTFVTRADWRPTWVFREKEGRDDAALIRSALDAWRAPDGDGYVWIAAEAAAARTLRRHVFEERGWPKAWLKAAGYWVRGKAGESEKFDR